MGARSILKEPPKGSELAARFNHLTRGLSTHAGLIAFGKDQAEDVFIELGEWRALMHEPRLWLLPADLVARRWLPAYLAEACGKETAESVRANEDLALQYARDLQRLAYLEANAGEKAREPLEDNRPFLQTLIFAEYGAVRAKIPNSTINSCSVKVCENLGGANAPLDRMTIRRAIEGFPKLLAPQSCAHPEYVILAVLHLRDYFRDGWQTRERQATETYRRAALSALLNISTRSCSQ